MNNLLYITNRGLMLFVVLLLSFSSCDNASEQERLDKMPQPVIVVAIDKVGNNCATSGAVTLLDGDGKLWSFNCITDLARSVSNSRQVGDTLR